jgi:hypothetical protein
MALFSTRKQNPVLRGLKLTSAADGHLRGCEEDSTTFVTRTLN